MKDQTSCTVLLQLLRNIENSRDDTKPYLVCVDEAAPIFQEAMDRAVDPKASQLTKPDQS